MFQERSARRIVRAIGFIVLSLAAGDFASAHPLSVVVEKVYVESDLISLDVVIFAEDLYFYHKLEANEAGVVSAEALRKASFEHGPLLLNRLSIYDSSGDRLTGGTVVSIEGNDFPQDIPVGELMAYDVRYRLELPLSSPPEFLSFSQQLVAEDAGFPALVDLFIKQAGLDEEVVATLKPGQVRTIRLTWDGAAEEADAADREAWMLAGREEPLSAGVLNRVRSFLYITPREVRHEILMPFPLLESFITIDRASADEITADEQKAARESIISFFKQKNPITIDGTRREVASARVEFFTLDNLDRTKNPSPRTVSTINSRVGILLTYPISSPAMSVELFWNAFNRQAWQVGAFCFVGDEVLRPEFSMATRQQRFEWTRPHPPEPIAPKYVAIPTKRLLGVPWLAILCVVVGLGLARRYRGRTAIAGATLAASLTIAAAIWPGPRFYISWPGGDEVSVTSDEADEIVASLHHNLYLACQAATEEEALDAIYAAADGGLRRRMYLQLVKAWHHPTGLGLRPASGEVKLTSGELMDAVTAKSGFDYTCSWEATGRVKHWGHVHSRRYAYEARVHVAPRDGRWLLTELDLKRVRLLEDRAVGVF